MRNRPDAHDLLAIAESTFRDRLIDALPDDLRYTALMIANAMANAGREVAAGDKPLRAELARLMELYPNAEAPDRPLVEQLDRFNRQLAADIRRGVFAHDPLRREQVRNHLVQTVLQRVRETNPKYLSRDGLG